MPLSSLYPATPSCLCSAAPGCWQHVCRLDVKSDIMEGSAYNVPRPQGAQYLLLIGTDENKILLLCLCSAAELTWFSRSWQHCAALFTHRTQAQMSAVSSRAHLSCNSVCGNCDRPDFELQQDGAQAVNVGGCQCNIYRLQGRQ